MNIDDTGNAHAIVQLCAQEMWWDDRARQTLDMVLVADATRRHRAERSGITGVTLPERKGAVIAGLRGCSCTLSGSLPDFNKDRLNG